MNATKPVLIVGAGISGLSAAYWLTKKGIPCRIVDSSTRAGGLLQTKKNELGLIELAANGFMGQVDVLEMCEDIKVSLAERSPDRFKRFIFRGYPRRWPLSFKETITFGFLLLKHALTFFSSLRPKRLETVRDWTYRCFNATVLEWLITPALQGIYAGRVDHMSATLVLGRFFAPKQKKPKFRGTMSPEKGMGQLIERLEEWLKSEDVNIEFNHKVEQLWSKDFSSLVLALPAWELSNIKVDGKPLAPQFSVDVLPLVSATLFFEPHSSDLKGFGCLFPRLQGFYALGVLFNRSIFPNRSAKRSETWILGGATNRDITHFGDQEIIRQILTDRKRLLNLAEEVAPIKYTVTKWERALPHITPDLERQLEDIQLPNQVYLTGNYLGKIGLSQIIAKNRELASEIASNMERKIV